MTAEEWRKISADWRTAPKYDFLALQQEVHHMCKLAGYSTLELQAFSNKCFDLASKINEEENRVVLDRIARKIWFNLLNSLDITKLLEDPEKLTPKEKSLLSLYYYLTMVETANSSYISFLAFMLVKSGVELRYRKRNAKNYSDVERVSLAAKIKFLKGCGLEIAVDNIDSKVRNCIAHQDFVVYDDGKIRNLKNGQLIEIKTKMNSLYKTSAYTLSVLKQVLDIISPSTDSSLK
jgi:hypothetical protein